MSRLSGNASWSFFLFGDYDCHSSDYIGHKPVVNEMMETIVLSGGGVLYLHCSEPVSFVHWFVHGSLAPHGLICDITTYLAV